MMNVLTVVDRLRPAFTAEGFSVRCYMPLMRGAPPRIRVAVNIDADALAWAPLPVLRGLTALDAEKRLPPLQFTVSRHVRYSTKRGEVFSTIPNSFGTPFTDPMMAVNVLCRLNKLNNSPSLVAAWRVQVDDELKVIKKLGYLALDVFLDAINSTANGGSVNEAVGYRLRDVLVSNTLANQDEPDSVRNAPGDGGDLCRGEVTG